MILAYNLVSAIQCHHTELTKHCVQCSGVETREDKGRHTFNSEGAVPPPPPPPPPLTAVKKKKERTL